MTQPTNKTPAELMNELIEEVCELRKDVGKLTTTAVSRQEAKKLMDEMRIAADKAFQQCEEVSSEAQNLVREMKWDATNYACAAARKAISSVQDDVKAAGNTLRIAALESRKEALFHISGTMGVFGGVAAVGAILGGLAVFWMQGRADARAFGKNPALFCTDAGGTKATAANGLRFCGVWIDYNPEVSPPLTSRR